MTQMQMRMHIEMRQLTKSGTVSLAAICGMLQRCREAERKVARVADEG